MSDDSASEIGIGATNIQLPTGMSTGGFVPQEFSLDHIQAIPGVGKTEYLFPDKAENQRSWGGRLCYGTGIAYLSGQAVGGTWGFVEGVRSFSRGQNSRLRINILLNSLTKRGPLVGNSFGVIALMYNGINGGIVQLRGGKEDMANSVVSATLTGAIFKSTTGVRTAGVAGGLGGCVAAALWLGWGLLNRDESSSRRPQFA